MADGTTATARPRRTHKVAAPRTADPIEIAMEAEASGRAPGSTASRLLEKQERLVEEQILLTRLERQARRFAVARSASLAAALVLVLLLAAAVVWNASRSRSVVVEPFDTPQGLVADGLSGRVAAQAVLDQLTALSNATRSAYRKRAIASAWSGEITIQAPGTGASLGEIERVLRARLGHDTRLGGDVQVLPDGQIAVTVRGDGTPARTFTGPRTEYRRLAAQAAEYIFGAAEPERMITFLVTANRTGEALALFEQAYPGADRDDRGYLLNLAGNALYMQRRYDEAAERFAEAVKVGFLPSRDNHVWVTLYRGREEEALRLADQYARAPHRAAEDGNRPLARLIVREDWDGVQRTVEANERQSHTVGGTYGSLAGSLAAYALARTHDYAGARAALLATPEHPSTEATKALVAGLQALEEGRAGDARGLLGAYAQAWRTNDLVAYDFHDTVCWRARALAESGDVAAVEAEIADHARYVGCQTARAVAFERAGQTAAADAAFTGAIALAPSAAFARQAYGEALLGRGDLAGAARAFEAAATRAPRWAEPIRGQAEVVSRQGRPQAAAGLFARAAAFAPRWGRLHLEWGVALAAQGKTAEAQAKWREAAGMDLTAAERGKVMGLLRQRRT